MKTYAAVPRQRLSVDPEAATTTTPEVYIGGNTFVRSVDPPPPRALARPSVVRIVGGTSEVTGWTVITRSPREVLPGMVYGFEFQGSTDPALPGGFEGSVATEMPNVPFPVSSAKLCFSWPEPVKRGPFRTELANRLWSIRQRIVASGAPLLDWDGVAKEVNERRGER
jgi:hypothetical protein